jgi:hypothetical protein
LALEGQVALGKLVLVGAKAQAAANRLSSEAPRHLSLLLEVQEQPIQALAGTVG